MPAVRPRVSITVDEGVYETLRRAALVQGKSMSAVVAELLEAMEPGLRRVADLGEAMERASAEQAAAIRRAVATTDEKIAVPLAEAMGLSLEALADLDQRLAAVVDPPGSNQGGQVFPLSRARAAQKARSDAENEG